MTDDKNIRDEKPEREETEQNDPSITKRVAETGPGEAPPTQGGIVQQFWRRIQEERRRPKPVEINTRAQNNMDRSKALLVLDTAVVLVGFAFLALFSTSGAEKRAQERRTKPSLGRPETPTQQAGATGSTVPLLSADQTGADQNGDQLSPDDILATSRRGQAAPQQQQQPPKGADQYALSNTPTFGDPALDAYRRQNTVYTQPPPPPPPPPAPAVVTQSVNDAEGLQKSSLVFVRNTTASAGTNASLGACPRNADCESHAVTLRVARNLDNSSGVDRRLDELDRDSCIRPPWDRHGSLLSREQPQDIVCQTTSAHSPCTFAFPRSKN
jgi:hypothetical protein